MDELLAGAGFTRTALPDQAQGVPGLAVRRLRVEGRWAVEARGSADPAAAADLGLTVEAGGAFIGPVHRALSGEALLRDLADIVASLGALAATSQSLRCPECNSYLVAGEASEGPFLRCAQPRRPGRFSLRVTAPQRCRGSLAVPSLVLHG